MVLFLKPKYNGQLELKSIQETTTVYFDEYGIPHIYAANAKDAMALGYVHARSFVANGIDATNRSRALVRTFWKSGLKE
jgi:hypothetical protein